MDCQGICVSDAVECLPTGSVRYVLTWPDQEQTNLAATQLVIRLLALTDQPRSILNLCSGQSKYQAQSLTLTYLGFLGFLNQAIRLFDKTQWQLHPILTDPSLNENFQTEPNILWGRYSSKTFMYAISSPEAARPALINMAKDRLVAAFWW